MNGGMLQVVSGSGGGSSGIAADIIDHTTFSLSRPILCLIFPSHGGLQMSQEHSARHDTSPLPPMDTPTVESMETATFALG
jgi:hypothetical protein